MRTEDIAFLGPMKVGKSTIAKNIAVKVDRDVISMDKLREKYFPQLGLNERDYNRHKSTMSELEFFEFCLRYEKAFLTIALEEYENCIFNFGGGNFINFDQRDSVLLHGVKSMNSFLLLPYEDITDSLMFLNRRYFIQTEGERSFSLAEIEINKRIIEYHLENSIAKFTLFVGEKSEAEIMDEVLSLIE
ncbi:shikimate kinase [Alteromonas sp. A079]|uniref:shikimate kinase n=1 Tax=Alteromonas sp. A079 TaxID=3410268 RepID=UPI003BA0A00B